MNYPQKIALIPLMAICLGTINAFAATDPNAPIVKLRYDDPTKSDDGCLEAGATIHNCFTSVPALASWITSRAPNASKPLLVEVGPGTYPPLKCTGWSNVTFRGAGRDVSIFKGSAAGLRATGCNDMDFQHLTFNATFTGSGTNFAKGVFWENGGSSRWLDVEVSGDAYGWYEFNVCSPQKGKHYWENSKIVATGSNNAFAIRAYYDGCGAENWFFGSELLAVVPASSTAGVVAAHQQLTAASETHFYGSVLRVNIAASIPGTEFRGVYIQDGSAHIHGTGIDVISTLPNAISAITVDFGLVHANGAAYNLDPGRDGLVSGTVVRIQKTTANAHVDAPYLWAHIPKPGGSAANFTSVDGADMTTQIAPDGFPHTLVYSKKCPSATPWYDQVDKVCRG